MAETKQKKSLPFGASPITLAFLGIGVVGALIYFLFPPAPESASQSPIAARPSSPTTPAQVSTSAAGVVGPGEEADVAVSKAEDELDTFLVSFGRPNPFAPVGTAGGGGKKPAQSTAPSGSNKDAVRAQLQNLQSGQPGAGNTAAPQPPPKPVFMLTGIVRMMDKALAVIKYGAKSYIVAPNSPLGETGYVLKEISGEDITLVSAKGEEQSLPLRRKEP